MSKKGNHQMKKTRTLFSQNPSSQPDLKTLGNQLLSSRAHVNNLPILLKFISPSSSPHHTLESLLSLQSFFTPLLPDLPPSSSKPSLYPSLEEAKADPEFIYRTWLRLMFDEFVKLLIHFLVSPGSEESLKDVVLDTIMEFVKTGNAGKFNSSIYHKFIHNIVHSTMPVDNLLHSLATKYFKYIDVCYFTYISVEKIARTLDVKDIIYDKAVEVELDDKNTSTASIDVCIHKIHYILLRIAPLECCLEEKSNHETWSGSGGNRKGNSEVSDEGDEQKKVLSASKMSKKMKLKFSRAWISFLRLPLPLDVYKEVLVTLQEAVIPHLANPAMLCDFLTRSYDIGGVVSVMALSSLYVLMTQYGIEYPNFYEKLYALLVPAIFMAKHRAKFFQLLDSCLKSPLLPAYLAAAFAKRLSRLALWVPPSGALIIIALIHNLLRRHPSINFLVHQDFGDGVVKDDSKAEECADRSEGCSVVTDSSATTLGLDHFNNRESDPLKSNAMRSSLWEIDTLRHHYCPPVSRFVLSLENDLTVRAKTTEIAIKDFSSGSYATIFKDEIGRRVKQVPLAFAKATTSLFSESEFPGWTFRCEDVKKLNPTGEATGIVNRSDGHDNNNAKRQRIECA